MSTVRGTLDQRHYDGARDQWVQVRTILLGGVTIRIHVVIGSQTIVARGIEPVALSSLRGGGIRRSHIPLRTQRFSCGQYSLCPARCHCRVLRDEYDGRGGEA